MKRAFAIFAALLMVLVSFAVMAGGAVAETAGPLTTGSGATTYGPGITNTPLPAGNVRVQYLPTFQRWDGAWRPVSALDRSAGEWPYLVEETATEIRVTRLGETFNQAKIPGAVYEFLPQGIKETIMLRSIPNAPVLSIPFGSTYGIELRSDSFVLRGDAGREEWETTAFHAWDSADPPRMWQRAVTSIEYAGGQLKLGLDPNMLATATLPLFIDPTWKSNASMGWPSVLLVENVVEDYGDHTLRIGRFADNFDDGIKDLRWTTDAGSWDIVNGAAELTAATRIRAPAVFPSWNASVQAKITITAGSAVNMLFRWKDTSNYYYLRILEASDLVELRKVASGSDSLLANAARAISRNTAYRVKIVMEGATFAVFWDGSSLMTATDSSPFWPSQDFQFHGFQTVGRTSLRADDVRVWRNSGNDLRAAANVLGILWTAKRNAMPQAVRTVQTGSVYNWVDILTASSDNNVSWGVPHYVKAGAESRSLDQEAYFVPDTDRRAYYYLEVDLRSTDDFSPALTEIAVIEGTTSGSSENAQVLGYEPWQYYVGGMVNVVNGNLFLRSTDLALPGKGWRLSFARAYNSLSTASGALGLGWTHSYNAYLTTGTGTVSFTDGDGSTHIYEDIGGGAYTSPRGLGHTKLVRNGDGTYTLSGKDGSKWTFSTAGRLTQMTDRNGNKVTLTYDPGGRLMKVSDDSGIFLMMANDANGRIVRLGDHNLTMTQRSPTAHSGSWTSGQNAFASDNLYASTKTASATHGYSNYGFAGPSDTWITKVEVCVEAHTAGDDDLGVRISTNGGSTWSSEQIVNLPSTDPNALTCLDFTSHQTSWTWGLLSNQNFTVQVRYVKVGNQASFDYLDWTPVRITAASRFVSYAYDAPGNLVRVTDPLGNSTLYVYSGIMEKMVDPVDKVLRFVKDASSRVTEVWTGRYNRGGGTIVWEFRIYGIAYSDWSTRSATVTDALGNATTITYDRLAGRPTLIDGPLAGTGLGCSCCGSRGGERWTIEWDGEHNWVSKKDGLNQTTVVEYDWRGNSAFIDEGPGVRLTENMWQNRDNGTVFDSVVLTQRRGRLQYLTNHEYDWKGNRVKTIDRLGNFTENTYDSAGFITKIRDRRGFNTTFTYDAPGWRVTATDPLNHTTRLGYDAVGRLASVTSPMGFTARATYNANDWPLSQTNPLGFTTWFEFNPRGDRTAVVDANGNRTEFAINTTWRRAERTIEATGDVTQVAYDKLGRLVHVEDPNGKRWKYEYDRFGRKTKGIDPLGDVASFAYDRAGNLASRIDGNGKSTTYTYDRLNRLLDVFYEGGGGRSYQYDDDANVVREEYWGPAGSGLMFARDTVYDALNRPTRVTSDYRTFVQIVQYTYDENGNRKTMVYPDGFAVTYVWNRENLVVDIQASGQTWTFSYDDDHRRTALRYPNGLQTNYTYDAASRLTALQTVDTSNWTVIEAYTYTYDAVGNKRVQGQTNSTTVSFAYNGDYSLNATTYESGTKSYYQYDRNDDRLYKNQTDGLYTAYVYRNDSSLSRQTVRSGGSTVFDVTYSYDKNGNLIGKVENVPGRQPVEYGFEYDLENRLVRVTVNGAERTSYAYTGNGGRFKRTESGTPTYYLYDFRDFNGFNDILGELNATGGLKSRYVHGPGIDEPLAKQYLGAWYYYHHDGLGSVTRLTDAGKVTKNSYVYNDFGGFRSKSETIPNFYGFTGREIDFATYFYRARYYDSEVGRFLTRDPSASGNNYAYVANNPVNAVDPSGQYALGPGKQEGTLFWARLAQYFDFSGPVTGKDFTVLVDGGDVYVTDLTGLTWQCIDWDWFCYADFMLRFFGTVFLFAVICASPPSLFVGCPLLIMLLITAILQTCVIDSPGTAPRGGICDCCRTWALVPLI